jgi:hypothetical protein
MELVAVEPEVRDLHGADQELAAQVEAEVQTILMVTATLIQVVAVETGEDPQDQAHMEMEDLEAAAEPAAQVEL